MKSTKNLLMIACAMVLLWSCSKDKASEESLKESQKIEAVELRTILETDGYASAADNAIIASMSQVSGKSVKSVECYTSDFTDTGYTLVFTDCAIEEGGETLNGTISVVYEEEGGEITAFTATYSGLSVDGITIDGTRSFSVDASDSLFSFTIVSDMTITLQDGSLLKETGTKYLAFQFATNELIELEVTLTGDWTVTIDEDTYVIEVTSPIVSGINCDYFSEGLMTITKNGFEATVDFGDGTCDAIATITYPDGTVEELRLGS